MVRHVSAKARRAVPRGQVAAHAVRRVQRVVVADVARKARRRRGRHVRARQREASRAVVEGSAVPTLGRMAVRAIRHRKCRTGSRVGWIIRLLPLRQVALRISAVRRRDLKIVIVVDVAGSARHIRVAVGQQESR